MRLFIDECLSPLLARVLNETGEHDAIHPRDMGRLGEPDHAVLARCLAEDRIIVTENAIDFRKLVGREEIHPGLLDEAIDHLESLGTPSNVMVNHVLEVSQDGAFQLFELP